MFLSSLKKGIFILERGIKAFQYREMTLFSIINCTDLFGYLQKDRNKVACFPDQAWKMPVHMVSSPCNLHSSEKPSYGL